MNPVTDAVLRSWPFEPWLLAMLALTALVYVRGWRLLHQRRPQRWHCGHPAAFLSGLAVLFLALASPLEPFAALSLQAHMLQHLLLMMAAPPLLWLGDPLLPCLRGLPQRVLVYWVAPFLNLLRPLSRRLTQPLTAWVLFTAATWAWHLPELYELALRSRGWHEVQHLCFLGGGLLFWYPVVRPYPSRPRWSRWVLMPYLLLADVQNTVLAALLTFSDRVLYPHYTTVPRLGSGTALDDQAAAGLLMWIPGSLAFLVPLAWIGVKLLFGTESERKIVPLFPQGRIALPLLTPSPSHPLTPSRFDLLSVPLLGRFLKWRYARLALQLPLLLLVLIVIHDGLTGPQVGAMNLAGVLPWIHWRGLIVLGLLVGGNVFCMACPFLIPRTLARHWLPAGRAWPHWLRSKWLAVGLLALFFWAYEVFALWDSPWLTAWIALGYFAAAFAIDGLFRGAAFCKYLCPIGQFNFVQSLASPLEVQVRDPTVCASCRTKDCIRGRDGIPGCELNLYLPRKKGNLDCTFCLDCAHACPHGNVAVAAVAPGAELWHDPTRSGVGRFGKRFDLSALVVVLTFAAFANAAGMVGPVVQWQSQLTTALGLGSPLLVTTAFYLAALLVSPALLVGTAAILSQRWVRIEVKWRETATRFSYALLPLGFAMWLAHYTFHLASSYEGALPAAQRWAADLGWSFFGTPEWAVACCIPAAEWLLRLEILFLDLGLLLSLYTAYRIAHSMSRRPLLALLPWMLLLLVLFAVGIWLLFQPMQMRGTMLLPG